MLPGALLAAGIACLLLGVALPPSWLAAGPGPEALAAAWWAKGATLALGAGLGAAGALLRRGAPPDRPDSPAPPSLRTPETLALGTLLLLSLALRLRGLGSDLWYDEIVTLVEFVRLPALELATTYTTPNNHILYSLLAKASVALFGESAWALRLPAALLGVGCVAALFALARRLLDHTGAFLAAALLAVSYHHVWFSQNARGYTGLMLAGLVATALFVEGLLRPRRGLWVAYALILALGMYVHLSAVFLFAAHGLVWLGLFAAHRLGLPAATRGAPGAREAWPLLGFVLGGLLTLQLYALLLPQMASTFGAGGVGPEADAPSRVSQWTSPIWTALEVLRGLRVGLLSGLGAAAAAVVAGLGFLRLGRRLPWAAAAMALPLPLTLGALLAIGFHVWPRYFLPYLGFALIFAVEGCLATGGLFAALARRAGLRALPSGAALGAGLAAGVALVSAASLPRVYRWPKQSWVAAREFVESRRGPQDAIVTAGLASFAYARYYAPGWQEARTADELRAIRAEVPRTWLVYSFPTYMRSAHPDLLDLAGRDFERVRTFPGTLGDGEIQVWRSADR